MWDIGLGVQGGKYALMKACIQRPLVKVSSPYMSILIPKLRRIEVDEFLSCVKELEMVLPVENPKML